ncbi:MAG TPA: transcriptional regulator [Hyphomonadaceae bacterium]|nr:transcriptional regulator [Hyphomonadaceae bacterium]
MNKINLAAIAELSGTRYPAPHDEPVKARRWKALGQAAGLTQFGVNLLTLPPGVWSSQRHWHTHEDEFAYVLSGEVTLVMGEGEEILRAGDCIGWKAGVENGHVLKNLSDKDAVILVVGGRSDEDHGEYSDIDMKFLPGRYSGGGGYRRKDGTEIG